MIPASRCLFSSFSVSSEDDPNVQLRSMLLTLSISSPKPYMNNEENHENNKPKYITNKQEIISTDKSSHPITAYSII